MERSTILLFLFSLLVILALLADTLRSYAPVALLPVVSRVSTTASCASPSVDLSWHPSPTTSVGILSSLEDSNGTYGLIFDSSTKAVGVPYGAENWCNMPHVGSQHYRKPSGDYKLEYVEVVSVSL